MSEHWRQLLDPRFLIALMVVGLFAWALGENADDDTMKGALIGALNLAVGYYLGSSRGVAVATENTTKALDLASANSPDAAAQGADETAKAAQQKADEIGGKA